MQSKLEMRPELELFLSSIRSEYTRETYLIYFKKYVEFLNSNDLFLGKDPKAIQDKIIEFITDMKSKGKGYSTIHNYIAAVLAFYKINDVMLNVSKINKFIPEQRVRRDRAYTHEEISKLLSIADERMQVVILLLASSGIRIGSIAQMMLSSLQDLKLTVYEGSKDQYFTFITQECKKAIDSYLDMRKRYGEVLTPESYLIREQFDVRDPFQISRAKSITIGTIKWKLIDIARRAGVRSKDVKASHGLRKFFTTMLIKSNVKAEVRLMLEGHSIGITDHYWRPTEQEMYAEYEKAIDNLTINEENRLRKEVKVLQIEKSKMDEFRKELNILKKELKQRIN
jgi:integrase